MSLDCKDYKDNIKCPKKRQFIKKTVKSPVLKVLMVGCWGVYCWDGSVKIRAYNAKKGIIEDEDPEIYGGKSVANGMIKYTQRNNIQAIFLAGDNVYTFNQPKELLIQEVKAGRSPSKKDYKGNHLLSGQNIEAQINEGFVKCLDKAQVKDFYIAIGNHDIQNCYDLNYQLNFSKNYPIHRYRLPAVYYNVIYKMEGYKVNFIVIDTNMYEERPTTCSGSEYTPKMINDQNKWVIKVLRREKCRWNIIVGHIPYKANHHKKKKGPVIKNNGLDVLFNTISRCVDCPKVQVYMCADEHNQQFLYDPMHKMGLVVAGSGGTALDLKIVRGPYWDASSDEGVRTFYYRPYFGFTQFKFLPNVLTVTYIVTDVKNRITGMARPIPAAQFTFDTQGNLIAEHENIDV